MGNTPEIRFKGYTDDWEQRKWIDTVDISTEMVDPTSGEFDDMPHIAPGNIESFTGRILDNVKSVKEEQLISGKFRFRPGDVVYGKINPQLGKYFYASVDGLTSADAYVFNGKNGISQKFLFSLLQTADFFKYSVSVSKRSGMPKINRDELNAYSFLAPNAEEQNKIGDILLELDHLITLHQRKCNETKKLKKYMLQKMFPKNGEKKPEIRFEGFTDDWEQRKLEEFGQATGGTSIESEFSEDGIYKVISIGSYSEDSIYRDQGIRAISSDKTTNRVLNKGDITMILNDKTTSGNIIGRVLLIEESGVYVYNQRTERIEVYGDKYDSQFIYTMLNAPGIREKIIKQSQGNTQIYVNWTNISQTDYLVPQIDEQKQIGEYFRNLDRLINLHQRKLEELQTMKKFMLSKMFV